MSRSQSLATGVLVLTLSALPTRPTHADKAADSADAWLAWIGADPLALAGFAAREGDEAVLSRLSPETDPAACLVAIEATPFMRSPELALLPLATLASGHDPDLVESSARRARQIAQALSLEGLASREILPATLAASRAALEAVSRGTQTRADIKRLAAEASLMLGALGVPLAEKPHP